MNQNARKILESYCENEIHTLKKSEYLIEICTLAKSANCVIDISFGQAMHIKQNKYPKVVYLGVSVLDQQGKTIIVDELDFEHLSDSTKILEIDRKNRVKFFSWQEDKEFTESLHWIAKELRKKTRNIQTGDGSMS